MDPIHEQEEFQEDFLYEDDAKAPDSENECSSEDLEECAPKQVLLAEYPAEPDESSAKSSLLHVTLGANDAHSDEVAGMPVDELPTYRGIAQSLPVSGRQVRMGSSVPVSIPHMNRWRNAAAAPDSPSTQQAATFVPPHQLSQVNDFAFSFTGDSPSVAIKRERLRVRNAILQSTGFLEPGVKMVNNIGLQERNRIAVGGLSQALQQQGGSALPTTAVS